MRTPVIRRLSGPALAVLLLVPAVPATALDDSPATAELTLDLQAALEAQGSMFGLRSEPASSTAAAENDTAEISLSELRAGAWTLDEDDDDPAAARQPGKRKRLGRWLKKHWYVPLIAAVALGATLDSGDGDASGEED